MRFNNLIPELSVSSISDSLDFYCNVLGFKVIYDRKENKFAFISLNKAQIMLEEINGNWRTGLLEKPFGRGINFQIEVENMKVILERIKGKKYKLFMDEKENWYNVNGIMYGSKEFLIQDPDGYLLRFSQDIGKKRKRNVSEKK